MSQNTNRGYLGTLQESVQDVLATYNWAYSPLSGLTMYQLPRLYYT